MLRRLLSGLSIASLLVGALLLLLWWRSYHHSDHFTLGKPDTDQTEFTTQPGSIWVATTNSEGGMITKHWQTYPFKQLAAGTLIIPAFWVAITIRAKLPRPGKLPIKRPDDRRN
jgi:hypothetical protein